MITIPTADFLALLFLAFIIIVVSMWLVFSEIRKIRHYLSQINIILNTMLENIVDK